MASALEIYLQNHEAAGQAGRDLFRRVAANQRRRPYGDELRTLAGEVQLDLEMLRALMRTVGCRPHPVLGLALRLGERLGRAKPNGRVITRSPLSDLIEVEALLDVVHAKRAGWVALAAAEPVNGIAASDIGDLRVRADLQIERLTVIHSDVAARVLTSASGAGQAA